MARPSLNLQLLLQIGRLAVYRSMWAVLREYHHPAITPYTSAGKADPRDVSKAIDIASNTDIEDTLHRKLGPTFDRGYYIVTEEFGANRVSRPGNRAPGEEDEQLIVFVDPVDFTAAASRGLDGSILLSFYHRREGMLASVVGDIFRRRIYCAAKDSFAYYQEVVFDDDPRFPTSLGTRRHLAIDEVQLAPNVIPLQTSGKHEPKELAINVFLSKPGRLLKTVELGRSLWTKTIKTTAKEGKEKEEYVVQEVYSVGGSLGPIRVADGTWDASIEFVKGFRLWDFAPGAFIASCAGASVIELDSGKEFSFVFDGLGDEKLKKENVNLIVRLSDQERLDKDRKKFIIASTDSLALEVRKLINYAFC